MKKLLLLTIAIWYLTAGCYSQTDWKVSYPGKT